MRCLTWVWDPSSASLQKQQSLSPTELPLKLQICAFYIFCFPFSFHGKCIFVGTGFTDLIETIYIAKNVWHQSLDSMN